MASGNPLAFIQSPNSTTFAVRVEANWNANLNPIPKKTSLGRRKIPIRKIEDKNKKHVTFSKRRKGLFGKARELCILCGASVAIITFSEAGKVFSFGHPSTDSVIHRYLHTTDPLFWWDRSVEELGLEDLEAFAASLERLRSHVQRRIGDLHQLDRLEPPMPVKNEILLYNNGVIGDVDEKSFDWSDFVPLPYPDQYQSGSDGNIGSIVGFNSNGGGFSLN